jgi:hypothetical protein
MADSSVDFLHILLYICAFFLVLLFFVFLYLLISRSGPKKPTVKHMGHEVPAGPYR